MAIFLLPVTRKHLSMIHRWRNNPIVRKEMFNTNEIPYSEHVSFWEKRLAIEKTSAVSYSYVIQSDDDPVGMARLDPDSAKKGAFKVDILLNPKFHGKGIGTLALIALVEKARELGISTLVGRVKKDNIASRRIFEKAGFVLSDDYSADGVMVFIKSLTSPK